MIREGNFHLFDILLQKLDSQSSHEEISDKLKLGHVLQMPNQDFSKVSFVKDKERQRLSQMGGDEGDKTTKHNMLPWMELAQIH